MTTTNSQHVIIGGPPRSGTTSLFTYLLKHPNVCGSAIKETHHFHPAITGQDVPPLEDYLQHFQHCSNRKYLVEATAAYFFGAEEIAAAITNQLGQSKIIFSLRDPVDRLISYFRNKKMVGDIPKKVTFKDFLDSSLDPSERGISSGYYIDYLKGWFHHFDTSSILILFFEELEQDPAALMQKVSRWLEIDREPYMDEQFTVENRAALYKSRTFHRFARAINTKYETFFRKHHGLKRWLRRGYYLLNEAQEEHPIQESTYEHLGSIYRPYNEELHDFLSAKGYDIHGWLSAYADPHR